MKSNTKFFSACPTWKEFTSYFIQVVIIITVRGKILKFLKFAINTFRISIISFLLLYTTISNKMAKISFISVAIALFFSSGVLCQTDAHYGKIPRSHLIMLIYHAHSLF